MDVIFIELEYPIGLLIAVRIREIGYINSYFLFEPEYPSDSFHALQKSDQFEELYLIPEAIVDDFDFKRRYKSRFLRALIHKKLNKDGR